MLVWHETCATQIDGVFICNVTLYNVTWWQIAPGLRREGWSIFFAPPARIILEIVSIFLSAPAVRKYVPKYVPNFGFQNIHEVHNMYQFGTYGGKLRDQILGKSCLFSPFSYVPIWYIWYGGQKKRDIFRKKAFVQKKISRRRQKILRLISDFFERLFQKKR